MPFSIGEQKGLTFPLLQYNFHFDKVHSYCFRVPDLHEASMMLEAVGKKPRFSSCVLISDTSVMTFSGGEGVFRLDGLQI